MMGADCDGIGVCIFVSPIYAAKGEQECLEEQVMDVVYPLFLRSACAGYFWGFIISDDGKAASAYSGGDYCGACISV